MERIHLPLQEYTQAQKLDLLETIWDDVTKNEEEFMSPSWHEPIIKESLAELESGKTELSDWAEAKERIKRNVQCK